MEGMRYRGKITEEVGNNGGEQPTHEPSGFKCFRSFMAEG